MSKFPLIRDTNKELSGPCCPPPGGLKELHRIHRDLPPWILQNNDEEVLQDTAGAPILDNQTGGFIYDNLKNGGVFVNG